MQTLIQSKKTKALGTSLNKDVNLLLGFIIVCN